jgi:alpha-tubulin suppressor-like RCC1 family protein
MSLGTTSVSVASFYVQEISVQGATQAMQASPARPMVDPYPANVAKIGHGIYALHSCAVLTNGKAVCWGSNTSGQLGRGGTTDSSTPVPMAGMTDATDVATGADFTCVLRSNGQVQCAGSDAYGQLGNGSLGASETLTDVLNAAGTAPLTNVAQLAVGNSFACVRKQDGTIDCWGRMFNEWNGSGFDTIESALPVSVSGLTDAAWVAAGSKHACAVRTNSQVQCWGFNENGALGIGATSPTSKTVPVTVQNIDGTGALAGAAKVRVGENYACAALVSGAQVCWGWNYYRTLAEGTQTDSLLPVTSTLTGTAAPLTNITLPGAGLYHMCAMSADGYVYCSGDNYSYSLGVGLPASQAALRAVTLTESAGGPPLGDLIDLGVRYDGACVLQTGGNVYCWGYNYNGQVGDGTTADQPAPVWVIKPASSEASIAALTMDAPAALESAWVSSTLRHTVTVPAGEEGVMFSFTPTVTSLQNVTGDSSAGGCDVSYSTGEESGLGGCTIVPTGTTYITLTATAEDGTTRDYTIVVTAQPHITDLEIDIPGLTPAFVSTTLNYQTEVPNGTNQLVVTPTLSAGATAAYSSTAGACTVNGANRGVASGAAAESATCPLFPTQTTTVTVDVTDGTTTRSYVIRATRAAAPDSTRKFWFPLVPAVQ